MIYPITPEELEKTMITWRDEYSVGIFEMDLEHQCWMDIYNDLHQALLSRNGTHLSQVADESIRSMYDYTQAHFKHEEAILKKMKYPDFKKHCQMHRAFESEIKHLHSSFESGDLIVTTDLLKKIKSWFMNHILAEDRKYSSFHSP